MNLDANSFDRIASRSDGAGIGRLWFLRVILICALTAFISVRFIALAAAPTPEELRLIREHQERNRDAILAGEAAARRTAMISFTNQLSKTGNRAWVGAMMGLRMPANEGIPVFLALTGHERPEVAADAVLALRAYSADELAPVLPELGKLYEADRDLKAYEIALLAAKLGERASPLAGALTAGLTRADLTHRARLESIRALAEIGEAARPALKELERWSKSTDLDLAVAALESRYVLSVPKGDLVEFMTQRRRDAAGNPLLPRSQFPPQLGLTTERMVRALEGASWDQPESLVLLKSLGNLKAKDAASAKVILAALESRIPLAVNLGVSALGNLEVGDRESLKVVAGGLRQRSDDGAVACAEYLKRCGSSAVAALPEIEASLSAYEGRSDPRRLGTLLEIVRGLGSRADSLSSVIESMLAVDSPIYKDMNRASSRYVRGYCFEVFSRLGKRLSRSTDVLDALANSDHAVEIAGAARCVRWLPADAPLAVVAENLGRILENDFRDHTVNMVEFSTMPRTDRPEYNSTARIEAIRALASLGRMLGVGPIERFLAKNGQLAMDSPYLKASPIEVARASLDSISGK